MTGGLAIWEIIWTGGLPQLSGLSHLPGVPHLHVNISLGPLDSSATYVYSCVICPLNFFIVVFRLTPGKCDSHTCMLQMNPRIVILVSNPKQHLAIDPSLAPFQGSEMLCHWMLGAPKSVDAFKRS